jgi:hypothetical protein
MCYFSMRRPVRVLRFFSAIFCQVLDIAVLNLFLIALDCNYFDQVCDCRHSTAGQPRLH